MPKKRTKGNITPTPPIVEQVEAIIKKKAPSRPRRSIKTKRALRELPAIDREQYPRTGQFIRRALSSGPTYIADLHQQYRKMQQEAMAKRGVIHKIATYHSFLTYCEKLILAGLLERTGERRPSSNPLTEPIDNPDRIYVQLTDRGLHAGAVWDAPLKFWYHGGGVDSQYIRSGATPRKPSVTKKPVVEKPIIERVKPKKEPKEKPPVSLLLPDLYAMRLKWLKFNPYQVPIKEIIDDITALPSRLDTISCKEAINQYTRGLQMLKPNDPASRDNLTSRWYWVLNCLQGIIAQEEGLSSPGLKKTFPTSTVPTEKAIKKPEEVKPQPKISMIEKSKTARTVETMLPSQVYEKWEEAERKNVSLVEKDVMKIPERFNTSGLLSKLEDIKMVSRSDYTSTEEYQDARDASWDEFFDELSYLIQEEEEETE